jgi:hypothetical protein
MLGKPKDNLTQNDRVRSLVQQLQRTPNGGLGGSEIRGRNQHHDRRQN